MSFSKGTDKSLNTGLGGGEGHAWIHFMKKPFRLAIFTSIRENNAWLLPAFEADVTKSTRTLFQGPESPRTLSQIIQLSTDWCSHNHCHPYIFGIKSVPYTRVTEPQIIRSRGSLRCHLAQTAYF